MNSFLKVTLLHTLCLLLFMTTQGGIPALALKNVFSYFKPGKFYCALNLGADALRTGIIENIRFNLVQQAFNEDKTRDFKNDKPYDEKDPVVSMVLILFPSHAGQLATEGNTNDNLGKHCTVEHIANLLKFADAVRTYFIKSKIPLPHKNITKVPKKLGFVDNWIPTHLPNWPGAVKNRNNLLTSIINVIAQEKGSSFYPQHLVEQIITAFFCHKFSSADIPALLQALGSNFIDPTKTIERKPITKEDVQSVMSKNPNSFTLDDIWMLLIKDDLLRITPYSISPSSYGLAKMYTKSPFQEFETSFTDCTESTLRHVVNLALYDPLSKKFDLSKIIERMKQQNPEFDPSQDPQFKFLDEFYIIQTPEKADEGTLFLRSLWNKVVADLGDEIAYLKEAGERKSNELDSGLMNITQVLNKLFNLNLRERPVKGEDHNFLIQAQEWIQEGFVTFFASVSNKKISLKFEDLKIKSFSRYGDIIGKIVISVNDGIKDLFSFVILSKQDHAQIEDLKELQEPSESFSVPTEVIKPFLKENSNLESLLLLEKSFKEEVTNPFYKIFSEPVKNYYAIINTLNQVFSLLINNLIDDSLLVETIIKNIFSIFPWQEQYASTSIQEIILKAQAFANEKSMHLSKALQEYVHGFFLTSQTAHLLSDDFFKNIEHLHIGNIESYDFSGLFTKNTIKTIKSIRPNYHLKKITNIEDCQNLEKLELCQTKKLEELIFSSPISALKTINLQRSNIKKITGVEYCQNLETLDLFETEELEKIIFSGPMSALRTINLENSGIKQITGLDCHSLETLNLIFTKNLEELVFSGPMDALKTLNLQQSNIRHIAGITYCQSLEILNLSGTRNLEELVFSEPMNGLKTIHLDGSGIKKITGLEFCQNLEILNLYRTENLDELVFSGTMNALKTINLQYSNIKKIIGTQYCPSLELLDLLETKNLDQWDF